MEQTDDGGLDFAAAVVAGEASLTNNSGGPDGVASVTLESIIFDDTTRGAVEQVVGNDFSQLLCQRAREYATLILQTLMSTTVVYGIEGKVYFLLHGLPRLGISTDEFVSIGDLCTLRHDAHLCSAIAFISGSEKGNATNKPFVIASAILAGVRPDEIGITPEETEQYVCDCFGKGNPESASTWGKISGEFTRTNKLLAGLASP